MNKENKSPADPKSLSQNTCAAREFFTAMLATIALAAAVFGIADKLTGANGPEIFSIKAHSMEATKATSIFREFAQKVAPTTETITEPESAYEKLRAVLDSGDIPTSELYVEAAFELLSKGAGSDAKAIIQSGKIAYPDSPTIINSEMDIRAATGEAPEIWTELAQTGDTTNPEVMSRLIKYATAAGKAAETAVILGDLELLPWTPSAEDWSNMVSMFTNAGDFDLAKDAVDESPEKKTLKKKLEAIEKVEKGDFDKALEKMEEYSTSENKYTAEDWALLGEIYTGLGDFAKADEAYREAEGLKKNKGGKGKM